MDGSNSSRINSRSGFKIKFFSIFILICISKNFTTSEENLDAIRNCLNRIESSKNVSITNDFEFEKILTSYKEFHRFIDNCSFDHYLSKFTICHPNTSPILPQDSNGNDDKNLKLLLKLSRALTNPRTIQLISSFLADELD